MCQRLGIAFLLVVAVLPMGYCTAGEDTSGTLKLSLPRSATPPDYAPERVSKLEIDGKDFTTPRDLTRTIKVTPAKGDAVTVVYTYWINPYTRIIRTKVVKVVAGKTTDVDFSKADKEHPDKLWVIFFPTPQAVVEDMCKLAKITKEDVVYDIGCGDGRTVITAVKKFKAKKGVGIDLLPERIKESNANAKKYAVEDRVTFLQKDALAITDYSEASVVLIYLSNPLNEALRPILEKSLKPGTRIVSHRFRMGDWEPDKSIKINRKNNYNEDEDYELHLWTVKAKK